MKARRDAVELVALGDVISVRVLSCVMMEGLDTRSEKFRPRFEYAAHRHTGFKLTQLFSGVLRH
jgi:hypothetical protein